ncbi:prepilin peptidase [Candidatus Saccharibacteria bacterium]|nr:prepilin peptidase [Candidatus Saccharibacteria bacterium]
MIFVVLAFLGLAAGSFVNALVWRLRQQELKAESLKLKAGKKELLAGDFQLSAGKDLSIFTGRSQCPHCRHTLTWHELIPLLSWLLLRGHCRYCGKPISWQYPIVELATAAVFLVSYSFWPGGVFGVGDWVLLITWLAASVGLIALLIYDLKWMLLPNKILFPALFVAVAGRLIYLLSFEPDKAQAAAAWALSVAVASGLFWLIFTVSAGKWIGYGDVRLGLITGTILADPVLSLLMIFVASVLGTLVTLPALTTGRKHIDSHIPFGPFLITATTIVLLLGQTFIDFYNRLLE